MVESVIQARVERSDSGGSASHNGEVAVSSDTASALQRSLQQTKEHAAMLRERFQKKIDDAEKVCVCKGCGKSFKNEYGINRHWSAKKNDCSSENGFEKVADVEVTPEDRLTERDIKIQKALEAARNAQKKVNPDYNSRKSSTGEMDAHRLMRYPIGNFGRALREAKTEVLEEFVNMRFDKNTAPKKLLAQKELEARLKKRG